MFCTTQLPMLMPAYAHGDASHESVSRLCNDLPYRLDRRSHVWNDMPMTKTMIALAAALLLTCTIAFHFADPTAHTLPAPSASATMLTHDIPSTDPRACHSDCGDDDPTWRSMTAGELAYMDQGFDGDIPSSYDSCIINGARTMISCPAVNWSAEGHPIIPEYVH